MEQNEQQYIVSARKYRPENFGTLIGQDNIARTLKNSILRGQLAHAYLFCGPRGVGKTTTARIFAKMINCSNPSPDMEPCGECESCRSFAEGRSYCIHELDAASNNGVEDIKNLMDQVRVPPQVGKYLKSRPHTRFSYLRPQRSTRFCLRFSPVARPTILTGFRWTTL